MSTAHPSSDQPVYLDPSRPREERVQDLIDRLTVDEKISLMTHSTPGIPRLGIPAYNYWNEALHGVARNGRATVFPQAIGMAATWDPDLIRRVGSAIGDEGRAKYHAALERKGETGWYQGLTFWSPNVNIFRDPRWGRGQETWGEDPYLTGQMGAAFVRGLQGDDPHYVKAAACAKHYAVHSGPERLRHGFDARVSPRDLRDTYLPAFETLVREAGVEAVMGAYNRVNGEPACASETLIVDILRGEWNFQGHFVSDCGALDDIHRHHGVTPDAAHTAALALKTGCDLSCGSTYERLRAALDQGLISEADIDRSLTRTLATRFKLGLFDPPSAVPFAATPLSVAGCDAHRVLAYEAAVKSVVLLKNRSGILPIRPDVRSLYLVGPTASNIEALLGNYFGLNERLTTILEGIVARLPEGVRFEYRVGSQLTQPTEAPADWTLIEAPQTEVVIACMGLAPLLEGEEGDAIGTTLNGDRADIGLPAVQAEFLRKLASGGAKIVLVLTGGSPIALGDLADLVEAIVFVWYPGQEGGAAVADVLFGQTAPSGKLPVTFPVSLDQVPPFEDYSMADRTYRYMTDEPLFPFGFGLSYTTFEYRDLTLERDTLQVGESLDLAVTVANTGAVEAEEVVQVYLSDLEASVPVPTSHLVAFRRVRLAPGQAETLAFTLPAAHMTLVTEAGQRVLEPGAFRVSVGGCSPGPRGLALGAPTPVSAEFRVL